MRYRDGDPIPEEQLAVHASDDMLLLTAVLATLIGFALFYLGRKGKQMWMWVWGIGLVIVSVYMGIGVYFDIKLFGYF